MNGVCLNYIRRDVHFNVDVIPGDDLLSADGADLDLDINNTQRLGADVDLDESWVDRLVKLSKARDEADRTCGAVSETFM